MTTDFFSPSSPRSRSIKSSTSRPRSPISAITLTSALVLRAIIPIMVLLPTPLPARIAIRWPFPSVINPSMARIPTETGSQIRRRDNGGGGAFWIAYSHSATKGPLPSIGFPSPSRILPNKLGPTFTRNRFREDTTSLPGPIPCISPSGINNTRFSRKPTTSAGSNGASMRG